MGYLLVNIHEWVADGERDSLRIVAISRSGIVSDVLGARDRDRRPKFTDMIKTRTNHQLQAEPQASDEAGRREASGSGPKRDA
jgi:hypothetical protein